MTNLNTKTICDLIKQDGKQVEFKLTLNRELEFSGHLFGKEFTACVVSALKQVSPSFKTMFETGTWNVTNGTANAVAANLSR